MGQAIRAFIQAGHATRQDIVVQSKLPDSMMQYDRAIRSIQESLDRFGLEYIDVYLIHSPRKGVQARKEAWQALCDAKARGWVRSIGVSNYGIHHLQELEDAHEQPCLNQIELSPWCQRRELVSYCQSRGILLQAYSPLTRGLLLQDEELCRVAQALAQSPAKVLIRWSLDQGFCVVPKAGRPDHLAENLDVFGFSVPREAFMSMKDMEYISQPSYNPMRFP